MNDHLSHDQFAECASGRPGRDQLEHLGQCPECSAELEQFGQTLSLFRNAVRDRVDDRVALEAPQITPRAADFPMWRWAVITAAVVVMVIPYFMRENERPQQVEMPQISEPSPEEVMARVNRHLSRTFPAPMEPMMSLIPANEQTPNSGGVQ